MLSVRENEAAIRNRESLLRSLLFSSPEENRGKKALQAFLSISGLAR